jgi:hypothetical protein
MSDNSSNISAEFNNYLANLDNPNDKTTCSAANACAMSGQPSRSESPRSSRSQTVSPETRGWEAFLAAVPPPANVSPRSRSQTVSPETRGWEAFLAAVPPPANVSPRSSRSQTVSPETRAWESFLAAVPPPDNTHPPSESEPPSSTSETPPESSQDDYRPSPVPKPVLYKPTGHCSPDEGNGDFLHEMGEFRVKVFVRHS